MSKMKIEDPVSRKRGGDASNLISRIFFALEQKWQLRRGVCQVYGTVRRSGQIYLSFEVRVPENPCGLFLPKRHWLSDGLFRSGCLTCTNQFGEFRHG
ncbi:hypothetical protein [Kiloniella majae]|uniref:hypothetical protein n=1 Tax=Kiloniella majae TaxID=1938558 RepID=UPI000F789CF2|nr:hypothetical protein [Kiloniella majae]